MAVRKAATSIDNAPRMGSPTVKQPIFDWKMPDKYYEICNFEMEVKTFLWPIIITYMKVKKKCHY